MAAITRAGLQVAYADETDGISVTILDEAVAQANALSLDTYNSTARDTRRRYLEALALLWWRRGGKSVTRQWQASAPSLNLWRTQADDLDQSASRIPLGLWGSSS